MGKNISSHTHKMRLCNLREALLKISDNYASFYMEELYRRKDLLKQVNVLFAFVWHAC